MKTKQRRGTCSVRLEERRWADLQVGDEFVTQDGPAKVVAKARPVRYAPDERVLRYSVEYLGAPERGVVMFSRFPGHTVTARVTLRSPR